MSTSQIAETFDILSNDLERLKAKISELESSQESLGLFKVSFDSMLPSKLASFGSLVTLSATKFITQLTQPLRVGNISLSWEPVFHAKSCKVEVFKHSTEEKVECFEFCTIFEGSETSCYTSISCGNVYVFRVCCMDTESDLISPWTQSDLCTVTTKTRLQLKLWGAGGAGVGLARGWG